MVIVGVHCLDYLMTIIYQGQIGVVAGLTSEERDVSPETTIEELILEVAKSKPAGVSRFLTDGEGNVSKSLFVVVDDEHALDYNVKLKGAQELLLMPPMAGG